jgi:hypothetical protein
VRLLEPVLPFLPEQALQARRRGRSEPPDPWWLLVFPARPAVLPGRSDPSTQLEQLVLSKPPEQSDPLVSAQTAPELHKRQRTAGIKMRWKVQFSLSLFTLGS